MKPRIPRALLIVLALVLPVVVALWLTGKGDPNPPLTPVSLQLSWTYAGSFAGYYAADQNGDYADAGLAVSFIQGGADIDPVEAVVTGQAPLGIANANLLIKARSEGKPVRAIAAIHRRNPVIFLTLKDSGITDPRQFAGKTIQVAQQSRPILRAVMNRVGIEPDQYRIVSTTDRSRFYSGEIDVWVGFLFYSTLRMEKAGYPVNIIYPANYGVHFYRNCLFTTEDFIAEHPDLITRFLRATLKQGWPKVIQNPETAGPLTTQYAPDIDVAQANAVMTAMVPLINTGEDVLGWMKPPIWADMTANLERLGMLEQPIDPTQVYTLRFLEAIYKDKQ